MTPAQRGRAAIALVEAVTLGDAAAAARSGVSARTLRRWRRDVETDAALAACVRELADSYQQKKEADRWATVLPEAIKGAVSFLRRAVSEGGADCRDPQAIHAVAGALKILTDTAAAWKILEVRLESTGRNAKVIPLRKRGEP